MDIKFKDSTHKERYEEIANKMVYLDEYHKSVAYIIALDEELYRHVNDVFDFEKDVIKHDYLKKPWQTGTSVKSTRLLQNLWNDWVYDSMEDWENKNVSRYFSVSDIFCSCLSLYCVEALKLRFPYSFTE